MIDEASQKRRSLKPIVDKMLSSSRNTGSEMEGLFIERSARVRGLCPATKRVTCDRDGKRGNRPDPKIHTNFG
jgi:hypothetical protein